MTAFIRSFSPGTGVADGDQVRIVTPHRPYPVSVAFGCAPEGGRHEFQGPIDPEPFAFVYTLATVIDSSGLAGEQLAARPFVDLGSVVHVIGYGLFRIEHVGEGQRRDAHNFRLIPVAA